MHTPDNPCCCDSDKPYRQCCQPWHLGAPALTPEQLMRSRYAAFVLRLPAYLLNTWHPDTRPATLDLHDTPDWQRLEILSSEQRGTRGRVHFRAHYITPQGADYLQEDSSFIKKKGRWYYHSGLIN